MLKEVPAHEQRDTGCPYRVLDLLVTELYHVYIQSDSDREAALLDSQNKVLDLIKRQAFSLIEILYPELDAKHIALNSPYFIEKISLYASGQVPPHLELLKTGAFEKILQGIHERVDQASGPKQALSIYISLLYLYDNIRGDFGVDFYQSCRESAANMLSLKLASVKKGTNHDEDEPNMYSQVSVIYQTALENALQEGMSLEQAIRLAQDSIPPQISLGLKLIFIDTTKKALLAY